MSKPCKKTQSVNTEMDLILRRLFTVAELLLNPFSSARALDPVDEVENVTDSKGCEAIQDSFQNFDASKSDV